MAVDDNFFGGLANTLAAVGAGAAAYETTKAAEAQAAAHAASPASAASGTVTTQTWLIIGGVAAVALVGIILLVKA